MVDEAPGAAAGERYAATPFPGERVQTARTRILESVLMTCGEQGYERTSVQDVIQRAQVSRATFYTHFAGKEDCFARAYRDASRWLGARVLGAAREQETWREGLRAGLAELLCTCAAQPAIAKAIFVEARAAGGRALAQHDGFLRELAAAIDEARCEIQPDGGPPPTTSAFTMGAVETLLRGKLAAGEAARVPEMLPALLYFVVMHYFGEEAAWEDLAATSLTGLESQLSATCGDTAD